MLLGTLTRAVTIALVLQAPATPSRPSHPWPENPRQLPSLSQRWAWKGRADAAALADGVIYVRGSGRISAIRADSGRVVWDTVCAPSEEFLGTGPVLDGDQVAASFGGTLVLLDRRSGRIDTKLELGFVHRIVASPLVVVVTGRKDRVDLVRVDSATGEVLARREVGGTVYDVEMAGSLVVALVQRASSSDPESEREEVLVACRAADLSEAWRVAFEGYPDLEWIDGALYASNVDRENENRQVFRRIDTEAGRLAESLPQRLETSVEDGLTWELETVAVREGPVWARLHRNSPKTGQPLWTADLPGEVRGWVRDGNLLYLHCDHKGGRGYFLVLDWATGTIGQSAYGLRDVRGLYVAGDAVIAWQKQGVTAFAAHAFGAPETRTGDVAAEVEAILDGVSEGDVTQRDNVGPAITDLETLGPPALPAIAARVPTLDPVALLVAARVLGAARYREAASVLAARLADPVPPGQPEHDRWDPAFALLEELSRLAGDPQVPAIGTVLHDRRRAAVTRRQALATLGSIGTPAAIRMVEEARPLKADAQRWWRPPTPRDFADLVGRPDLKAREQAARDRQDWTEATRIERAAVAARVTRPDGGALLVFHDTALGGRRDLWVSELDQAGGISPGRFIGGPAEGPFTASLEGGTLTIERTYPSGPLRVDLAEIAKDGDGDGLTDVVEARLGTDPTRRDTDGDALIDPEDPAPNGVARPRTEDDEVKASIFQQFFPFEEAEGDGGPELAIMVGNSPLEWTGRHGPTITLNPVQDDQFREDAGLDGIAHIFIGPAQSAGDSEKGQATERRDERRYVLSIYRGPLNAAGYDVTVRRVGHLWVMTKCRLARVS